MLKQINSLYFRIDIGDDDNARTMFLENQPIGHNVHL